MLEHPTHGARVRFDRTGALDGDRAAYAVTVWLPEARIVLTTTLERGAREIRFEAVESEPPGVVLEPWLDKYLQTMARQLARASQSDGSWPRKLVQWHAPA
jgi:hypothetical protein